jgi:beta-galactosidase
MSYNLYYGWYVGELEDNDKFFDEFHEKYPNRVIGLSEYGADTFYKLQSAKPQKGDYTEQYQALYHEHMLEMFSTRPYLWSTFVWNMFDFAADGREEAGDNGVNHKGLVTFDRKVKKDAFYIYKAWWSKEPFVHLCGSRYVDRTEEETEIKVYSNQTKVTLFVDGQKVEEKEGCHIFTFQITIHGEHHIEVTSDECRDEIRIRKVDEPNPEYRLKDSTVCNWFEEPGMEIIPGYYSIKDTMGDIKKSPAGAAIIDAMMAQASSALGSMAEGVEITEAMQQMTNRFTVEKLLKQGGNSVKTEMILALNQQLTKIKKPEELL